MKTKLKYSFLFFFSLALAYPQNTESISKTLKKLQAKNIHDTTKISLYLTLASEYISYHNDSTFYFLDKAEDLMKVHTNSKDERDAKYLRSIAYYTISDFDKAQWSLNQTIALANAVNDNEILAQSYNLMGAIQFNLGNYPEAIKQYNNKLDIVKALGDTISIIETYYNISLINNAEGSYYKSLENNYAALGLSQKLKDSVSMMVVYEGLGISYSKINDTKKAIINLKKALQIAINYGKTYEEAGIWVDLGNVYQSNGEQEKALYYFKRGEETAKRNGDKLVESIALSGKGFSLMKMEKFEEALSVFAIANKIHNDVSYKKGIAENQLHMSECNIGLGKYKEARTLALNSLLESKEIGEKKLEGDAYFSLSKIYEKLNNSDSAYLCFKKHIQIDSTLSNRNMIKKIADFEAALEKEKKDEEQKNIEKLAKAEFEKQRQIRNIVLAASGIVMLLLLFYYRNFKKNKKANIEIKEKKLTIEHKNKDLFDSINYAKRLQTAILPNNREIKLLLPGAFVLYKPNEIVSGNFYYAECDEENVIHVAVADSAKQGVPGAFMSISIYNILKQVLKKKGKKDPSAVLNDVDKGLNELFRNDKNAKRNEGVQMACCNFDPKEKKLKFSGSGIPLWISRTAGNEVTGTEINSSENRSLYELKAPATPLGKDKTIKKFTNHEIDIVNGDIIYFFTEGALSQFNYEELSVLLNKDNVTEELITNAFNNPKTSPTKDVCLMAIRF
jgi:tetratricopeptide (TPR) repeat protein